MTIDKKVEEHRARAGTINVDEPEPGQARHGERQSWETVLLERLSESFRGSDFQAVWHPRISHMNETRNHYTIEHLDIEFVVPEVAREPELRDYESFILFSLQSPHWTLFKTNPKYVENFDVWNGTYFWESDETTQRFGPKYVKTDPPTEVVGTDRFVELIEERAATALVFHETKAGGRKKFVQKLLSEAKQRRRDDIKREREASARHRADRLRELVALITKSVLWLAVIGALIWSSAFLLLSVL